MEVVTPANFSTKLSYFSTFLFVGGEMKRWKKWLSVILLLFF